MKIEINLKLEEGNYTNNYKNVDIVDSKTKEIIAKAVKNEYAEAIIKAVNSAD